MYANNVIKFEQVYKDIVIKIEFFRRDNSKTDIFQLVYDWLDDEKNDRWFMIIDNVDDDEIFFVVDEDNIILSRIRSFKNFILQSSNETILIISRYNITTNNFVESHDCVVQMNSMNEKDALTLFNAR
jgi:hypothetical protein